MASQPDDDLELTLLRAVRRAPRSSLRELSATIGLPRTTFGRSLSHRLEAPLEKLRAQGLIDEERGRYRLSEAGRRLLADLALNGRV